jgi:nitrogenase molybdenum-iron protein beta chain
LAQDGDRNGCALHGSVRLLEAIEGVVPILHASPGCGASAGLGTDAAANSCDGPVASVRELSATLLQEKQVVFGGTARLREQIKNTLKVHNGDLYVVVTGCVPEIVGDDTPAMVKEAREQRFPVIGVASPGFKGHAWTGYAQTARALLDQASLLPSSGDGPAPDVNLLGLVPGQDPGWEGDLLESGTIAQPPRPARQSAFGIWPASQRLASRHARAPHPRAFALGRACRAVVE